MIQLVYVPDHAKRRIRVQMQGAITAADTVAYIDQRITEGTRGYSVLYDTGEAGSLATSEDIGCVIRHLQSLEASLGCSGPVAIVSRSRRAFSVPREDPVDDHDGRALRFFHDVGDAERWLDHELTRTVDQLRTFSTVIPVAHRIGPS